MRGWAWLGLALAACTLVLVRPPAAVTSAGAGACQRLLGSDLAPATTVKLVKRRNHWGGTHLVGCVLPRGRVARIASSQDLGTTVRGYRIRQVANAVVLLDESSASQYADTRTVSVVSLRSGRSYEIAYACSSITAPDCGRGGAGATAPAAFVSIRGQAAAVLSLRTEVKVVSFSAAGRRHELATGAPGAIAPDSLRLRGRTVMWTNAGRPASATLPG